MVWRAELKAKSWGNRPELGSHSKLDPSSPDCSVSQNRFGSLEGNFGALVSNPYINYAVVYYKMPASAP